MKNISIILAGAAFLAGCAGTGQHGGAVSGASNTGDARSAGWNQRSIEPLINPTSPQPYYGN